MTDDIEHSDPTFVPASATLKAWFINFLERQWTIVMLLVILLLLLLAHTTMLHWNRPANVIIWCEGMIGTAFGALIAKLK